MWPSAAAGAAVANSGIEPCLLLNAFNGCGLAGRMLSHFCFIDDWCWLGAALSPGRAVKSGKSDFS